MSIVRIWLPYGAHVKFDGVEKITAVGTEYIAFMYQPKDASGKAVGKEKAHAAFCTKVIAGYSVEEE